MPAWTSVPRNRVISSLGNFERPQRCLYFTQVHICHSLMNDQPWQDNFILGNWLNLQRPAVCSDCKMSFCLFFSLLDLIIIEGRIHPQPATKPSAVIYDEKLIMRLFPWTLQTLVTRGVWWYRGGFTGCVGPGAHLCDHSRSICIYFNYQVLVQVLNRWVSDQCRTPRLKRPNNSIMLPILLNSCLVFRFAK